RVDGPEGKQDSRTVCLALFGQAGVDSVEVLVQQPLVASRPGLLDSMLAQLCDQRLRSGVLQLAERPVKHVDVGVDDAWRGIDTAVRFLALDGAPRQRPKGGGDQRSVQKSPPGQLPHDWHPPGLAQVRTAIARL